MTDSKNIDECDAEEIDKAPAYYSASSNVNLSTFRLDEQRSRTGNFEWRISEIDLHLLAIGMYVLSSAGSGNPESTRIMLRDQTSTGHHMRMISIDSLANDSNVYWSGHMGSPSVSVERLVSTETVGAVKSR